MVAPRREYFDQCEYAPGQYEARWESHQWHTTLLGGIPRIHFQLKHVGASRQPHNFWRGTTHGGQTAFTQQSRTEYRGSWRYADHGSREIDCVGGLDSYTQQHKY